MTPGSAFSIWDFSSLTSDGFQHAAVMPREVLELLAPHSGGVYLDGTLGGGGHAQLVLETSAPDGRLIGLDRDAEALAAAHKRLAGFADRVVLARSNFAEMGAVLDRLGVERVDGVLLDLGVSSHQLDSPGRGFSFRDDGPLDMRMDVKSGVTAAEVVATAEADELRRIFRDYGEERFAGRIASEIVRRRERQAITTTLQLAELVSRVVPGGRAPQRIHPATRVFQALRIHVNGELESLEQGLAAAWKRLRVGGRLVVISFHSLEDRRVKRFMRDHTGACTCPPRLAVCVCGQVATARLLTRKALRATDAETAENPRARSAVLRGAEKISEEEQSHV
jgi:16S rRNA (cytosine1402-N4)-methyltransferase